MSFPVLSLLISIPRDALTVIYLILYGPVTDGGLQSGAVTKCSRDICISISLLLEGKTSVPEKISCDPLLYYHAIHSNKTELLTALVFGRTYKYSPSRENSTNNSKLLQWVPQYLQLLQTSIWNNLKIWH